MLSAETIAIGSELLVGGRVDNNSVVLAQALGELGIVVRFKSVVGDDRNDIASAMRTAAKRAKVILLTGGLGPTVDDRTREAVAAATGRRLKRHREALEGMTARLAQWGRTPSVGQMRQALIPAGATVLANPVGSAPGFCLVWSGAFLAALPGVPSEMEQMFAHEVAPQLRAWLAKRRILSPQALARKVFHTFGLSEAEVDAKLKGLLPRAAAIDLGLLALPMGISVSLTSRPGTSPRGRKQAERATDSDQLARVSEEVRRRLTDWLFAEGSDTMEIVVGRLLLKRGLTLAVAESCTGGLIGHRLTQVPGSSTYLDRIAVCYSNRAKTEMLGVAAHLIAEHGAVSQEIAAAMAKGVRERSGVSVGLSVTGIAGPGGATDTKPVGLVYVGLDGGQGEPVMKEFRFHGDRSMIKQRSSQAALNVLRQWLLLERRA